MFPESNSRLAHKADNLTGMWVDCVDSEGSLTSHNPIGLYGLLLG
jgi:hypothetical protein